MIEKEKRDALQRRVTYSFPPIILISPEETSASSFRYPDEFSAHHNSAAIADPLIFLTG